MKINAVAALLFLLIAMAVAGAIESQEQSDAVKSGTETTIAYSVKH